MNVQNVVLYYTTSTNYTVQLYFHYFVLDAFWLKCRSRTDDDDGDGDDDDDDDDDSWCWLLTCFCYEW